MRKNYILKTTSVLFILCLSFGWVSGQEVGEIKLKDSGFKEKKFNDAKKRIFIQYFNINYQMMYGESETARGGRQAGGGYRGDASASLTLGVQGVDLERLQKITDSCYANYIQQLKSKGFEIVNPEELSGHEYFEDWEIAQGGKATAASYTGYISTSPNGATFLVSKLDEKGRPLVKNNIFDLAGMKLSKTLDGLIIARVDFMIPFARGAESQGSKALTKTFGGVAKVVIKPDLRIAPQVTIPAKGDFKKPTFAGSSVSFAFKKSLKYQALFQVKPKKDIQIEGVFEEKKYKAVQSGGQDLWGSNVGAMKVFSVEAESLESVQPIPCDGDIYEKGVEKALQTFMNMALAEFLGNLK